MSANNDEAKVLRTFDGTQKVFPVFMTWLKGILVCKGIVYIMKAAIESLLPKSKMITRQTVDQKQLVKDNQIGMGIVTMNVTWPSLIVKIKNLTTEDWPSGLFYKVMEMPNKKYLLKDVTLRVMQNQELNALTLKASEDPDKFGTKILRLKLEHKHTLSEEDKITALVGAAGPKYANTIFNKTRLIESKDGEVTCEALVTVCRGSCWRLNEAGKTAEMKEKELSLANPGSFAKSNKCFLCGSIEHMKHRCPKYKEDKGVKCAYPGCTVYGHRKEDCWEDPKNAHKRCPGWVSRIKKPNGEAQCGLVNIF